MDRAGVGRLERRGDGGRKNVEPHDLPEVLLLEAIRRRRALVVNDRPSERRAPRLDPRSVGEVCRSPSPLAGAGWGGAAAGRPIPPTLALPREGGGPRRIAALAGLAWFLAALPAVAGGLSPREARDRMVVPEGFRVEVFA